MKTTLFITLYNGRIDISHIVKTLGIILINLTNTIVQNIVMAYSHILMVMLGEEVEGGGGGVVWGRGAFFKMLYMFKIFFMVALGNYVTFSPNLSKFSGRKWG